MAQLRSSYREITRKGAEVVVVGPEDAAAFEHFWRKEDLPFVGVPDAAHSVLKRYGQEVNLFKLGRVPAQVIIDRDGVVRWVHYGHSMADIPSSDEVLELLDQLAS